VTIRLDRLRAWLKRLQWPLAWRGFLKRHVELIDGDQPLPQPDLPAAPSPLQVAASPPPTPEPVVVEAPPVYVSPALEPAADEWVRSLAGAEGEETLILVPPDEDGCWHYVTGVDAAYDGEAVGELVLTDGEPLTTQRLTVRTRRRRTWGKPTGYRSGQALVVSLAGVPGRRGRVTVTGITKRGCHA
jgi:hypothetical protein